jgi:hypothetical protein
LSAAPDPWRRASDQVKLELKLELELELKL